MLWQKRNGRSEKSVVVFSVVAFSVSGRLVEERKELRQKGQYCGVSPSGAFCYCELDVTGRTGNFFFHGQCMITT